MPETTQLRTIGPLTIDLRSGEVQKNGRKLRLQEQPFQVLAALLERAGEVVTREELRQRVWPANTFVDFNNGLNIAIVKLRQALNDDATKPRFIETLPRRGYRFIGALEEPLDGPVPVEAPVATEPAPAEPLEEKRSKATMLAMGATTLAVLGLGWTQFLPSTGSASAAINLRPSAAIMGFRDLGSNKAEGWVSVALAEMLSTELAAGDRLRTIPGESVARCRTDLALPEADSYAAGTLGRIHRNLDADYVVVGSYLNVAGGPLRVDVRLQDTRTGQTIASIAENGSAQNLSELVARAGLALRMKLNVAAAGQAETNGARNAIPGHPDTTRLYAEGLALLRRFDAAGARTLMEQAITADPGFALAHAALARAWSQLGYGEHAKDEAKKAWQLSSNLPRADRLTIEGTHRMMSAEWDKAVMVYDRLRQLFPDTVEYGVQMASAQVKAGKGKEALATLEHLHRLPAPLREDPGIDLMQSVAAEQTGDLAQAQSAAAKGAGAAQTRGSQMLVAESRAQECRMLRALGRLDAARDSCERARQIYSAAGDRRGLAQVTGYLAAVRNDEGDLTAAQELYSNALAIEREIGNEGGAIWALNGLAEVMWSQGDLSGARKRYEDALDAARKTASRADQADAVDAIAIVSLLAGDLGRARQMFEQAVQAFRTLGDKSGIGNALGNLGETIYLQGDLTRATQILDEAAAIDRDVGSTADTAAVLACAGRVLLARGEVDAARKRFDESLKIWQEMGSPGYVARHRLRYAELAIDTGHPADAEGTLREVLPLFAKEKQRDNEMEARALLARALLESGKTTEARSEIASAAPLAKGVQNLMTRLAYETAAAQTLTASGKPADANQAVRRLETLVADAGSHGFLEYQLKARMALGVAKMRGGHADKGSKDLKSVEQEARGRGFGTIARKAAALSLQ